MKRRLLIALWAISATIIIAAMFLMSGCALPPTTPDDNFNACLAFGGAPSYTMAGTSIVKFECARALK